MENLENNKLFIKGYILLVATIVLYYCSECGPLYLTNFWTDANVYFTIGRGMREGLVPYVDLYDHKGPVIYFIHMLAAYISPDSFIGVWFIEIIASFCFLYASHKLLELFCKERSLVYIPLMAVFIYCSNTFAAGDSAEELCLPILAYSLYISMKALKNGVLLSKNETLFIGLGAAYVFWLKFTMVGFFVGYAIAFGVYSLKNNLLKSYWQNCWHCFGAFGIASLGVCLVFYILGGLDALIKVYFFDNIFSYNNTKSFNLLLENLKLGVFSYTYYYRYGTLMTLLGWHYLYKCQSKSLATFSLVTFICLFLTTYIGGRGYNYYSFIFSLYVSVAFCFIDEIFGKFLNFKGLKVLVCGVLLCMLANPLSYNKLQRNIAKDDYYLEPFAQIIRQEKNPSLINYRVMDLGLYNYCGIVPRYKHFSMTNIRKPEMFNGLKKYIEEGKVDFVFSLGEHAFKGYKCVLKQPYNDYGNQSVLCLYKKSVK